MVKCRYNFLPYIECLGKSICIYLMYVTSKTVNKSRLIKLTLFQLVPIYANPLPKRPSARRTDLTAAIGDLKFNHGFMKYPPGESLSISHVWKRKNHLPNL